ncbi:hypothetical protein GJ496_011621 [Pomphorhynchus laevis]|nr:hypothetical protein GJ496_011621 [Pomphorhynchus laevis]
MTVAYTPPLTFHCLTRDIHSYLDAVIHRSGHHYVPTLLEQQGINCVSGHDSLNWRIGTKTQLNDRFIFSDLNIAAFNLLLKFQKQNTLQEIDRTLQTCVKCLQIHRQFDSTRKPSFFKTAKYFMLPEYSDMFQESWSKIYWRARYKWRLEKDTKYILRCQPNCSDWWKTIKANRTTHWKSAAKKWIAKSSYDNVNVNVNDNVTTNIINYHSKEALCKAPIVTFRPLIRGKEDLCMLDILSVWGRGNKLSDNDFSVCPKVANAANSISREKWDSIMLNSPAEEWKSINTAKRILLAKKSTEVN